MAIPKNNAVTIVVPGDLETRTGGYGYDRRIIAGLRDRGWSVTVLQLADGFPCPTPAMRDDAARTGGDSSWRGRLSTGSRSALLPTRARSRGARIHRAVHHPSPNRYRSRCRPEASERRVASAITSRATAAALGGPMSIPIASRRRTRHRPGTTSSGSGSYQPSSPAPKFNPQLPVTWSPSPHSLDKCSLIRRRAKV
jgi:hypothetical protein